MANTEILSTEGPSEKMDIVSSAKQEITNSPSVSSLSSINSNNSTSKLIESLSMHKLNQVADEDPNEEDKNSEKENNLEINQEIKKTLECESGVLPKSNAVALNGESTPLIKPSQETSNKKPIKFKVRKVSRETIPTPNQSRKSSMSKEHDQKPQKSNPQLRAAQYKYDQYAHRIEKINKEIEFLANLLPPYNVEIDYNTRTKITKAIEKLKMKQDELEKKKYSLGITISRLWRELDDSDIWIRSFSNQ